MTQNINLANIQVYQGFPLSNAYPGSAAGNSIAFGDINGDGLADVIIGAPEVASNGQTAFTNFNGRVYVCYGQKGNSLSGISLSTCLTINGISNSLAGESVSAGKINNDKYYDIIIGATGYSNNAGRVYIIYGGENLGGTINLGSLTTTQGFTITGEASSQTGASVSSLFDLNKDGYDDIVIGAPVYSSWTGKAYIVYGGDALANINLASLTSSQGFSIYGIGGDLGVSVSTAGDFNNDGYSDVIIGANGYASHQGIAFVIYGGKNLTNIDLSTMSSSQGLKISTFSNGCNLCYIGTSVSMLGDVNNDNYTDVIIGAPDQYTTNPSNGGPGKAYVIYGGKNLTNIDLSNLNIENGFSITGEQANSATGFSVSTISDLNNDNYDEIVISAPVYSSGTGRVYVIYGGKNLTDINLINMEVEQGFTITGVSNTYYTGSSVSGAGDFNGDGYNDIAIGADGYTSSIYPYTGIAYVVYGTETGFVTEYPTFSPTTIPTSIPTSPTTSPTLSPTLISTTAPSHNPTISNNMDTSTEFVGTNKEWYETLEFKVSWGFAVPIVGFIVGWIFREKIAFHILSNWGYKYELLYNSEKVVLTSHKIGFCLSPNEHENKKLLCKIKAKYINVEIDNGNNNGLPKGLYDAIVKALNTPQEAKEFIFLRSEENKIYDFLLSRDLVNLNDLGYMQGSIYKVCLGKYKLAYREKYSHIVRIQGYDRQSYNENPLHTLNSESSTRQTVIELRESSGFSKTNNQVINNDNAKDVNTKPSCLLLSIDAIDQKYIEIQNEEFSRFGSHLISFINEEIYKNINYLLASKSNSETLFLETRTEVNQVVIIYQRPTTKDNFQFVSSDNLMLSLLNVKQILYNLPLIHYVAQNTINYLGYNITLPNPLDNKAVLISIDLILGNAAVQFLSTESVMNGMFISTASTASFAVKLTVADYLKNQEPSDNSIEFVQRCGATIAAYSLPGLVNYLITKAILPDAKMYMSALDILGGSGFGVVQCYNNYKAVYATDAQPTATDIVVPYIADAITLWSLRGYTNFDASSDPANLMLSIKNAMSVAATTYAMHCTSSMVMDMLPQEVKKSFDSVVMTYIQESYESYVIQLTSSMNYYFDIQ